MLLQYDVADTLVTDRNVPLFLQQNMVQKVLICLLDKIKK